MKDVDSVSGGDIRYSDGFWYVKAECKKICVVGYGELMRIQRRCD